MHFNIIIVICYLLSVVKTNAEMSRFRISCQALSTPICDRDKPITDRQRTDTTVHRIVQEAKLSLG